MQLVFYLHAADSQVGSIRFILTKLAEIFHQNVPQNFFWIWKENEKQPRKLPGRETPFEDVS